jgi:hypothetical protein
MPRRTVTDMTSTPPNDPPQRSTRSLTSRTSLLTAAAIAGVLLAGTAAVAANIGILNAADSSAMGELTATDELLPAVGADVDTTIGTAETTSTSTTVPASASAGTAQQYDIAGTGTVWVMTTRSGLALDHVVAEPGWSSVLTQGDLRSLQVDFTSGDRTIVFTAALGDDGALAVDVTEPTTVLAPALTPSAGATPTTAASSQYDDDQYESEDDDQYESEDDDQYESEDDDQYEDEEHDEYEGADDDD